jgi:hypothetical protein
VFTKVPTGSKPGVFFANYDMVQAEIYWVRNENMFNATQTPEIDLYSTTTSVPAA